MTDKEKLGQKRICGHCEVKFYDLNKSPAICPKCKEITDYSAMKTNLEVLPAKIEEAADETSSKLDDYEEESLEAIEDGDEDLNEPLPDDDDDDDDTEDKDKNIELAPQDMILDTMEAEEDNNDADGDDDTTIDNDDTKDANDGSSVSKGP